MRSAHAVCLFLILLPVTASNAQEGGSESSGTISLFDGKTLDGWRKVGGGATYHVEDGAIVGEVGPGANAFLRTEKTYGDFILKLDAKLVVPGNSGIQFRSHQQDGDGRVFGYQCEIDPSDRKWTAGIYDEGRRGWLFPLEGHPEAQAAFHGDDWNAFTIEARGPWLRTWLNGVPCADLIDTADLEGFLALQVHAGSKGQIRWKNIELQTFATRTWKPLFDGQSLAGWHSVGIGKWTVDEGAIHGVSSKDETQFGYLVSENTFKDFAVRVSYQCAKGDSGVFFRAESGGTGVKGLQAEITPFAEVGGLFDIGGRGWLQPPPTEENLKKWLKKPGEWNELAVVALGDRLVVQLNGHTTAEVRDPSSFHGGHLALQLHSRQDMDVKFKSIDVMDLADLDVGDATSKP